jgi:hypothetical protein
MKRIFVNVATPGQMTPSRAVKLTADVEPDAFFDALVSGEYAGAWIEVEGPVDGETIFVNVDNIYEAGLVEVAS